MSKFQRFSNYLNFIFKVAFLASFIGLIALVFDFGYNQSPEIQKHINTYYFFVLTLGVIATIIRYLINFSKLKSGVLYFDIASLMFILTIIATHFIYKNNHSFFSLFYDDIFMRMAIILTFIREFAALEINFKRTFLNPAQLFVISFLTIIVIGTFLLMLPNATHVGISFTDAFFTSTSAVCVTGLIVVDTGSYFTQFGQIIIMILIQLGGLGILTFASYFSYFFKGGSTYENHLTLSDMTNSEKIGEVFRTLKKIIITTFTIELIGFAFIYNSLDKSLLPSVFERTFFSVFHAISAFCNAGFSTLPNSLYEEGYRFNYPLHLTIIGLFVLGGLGFPIVFNLLKYIKYFILRKIFVQSKAKKNYVPWVLHLNSRITLITTLSLTVIGTILFYISEYHNTLQEHSGFGKVVTALFGAATPRTAGFNTVDTGALHFSTTMIIFLLMWIGASPASTGGGIKTSTFAIAILNFLSLAKGKTRIEVYRREIADISVRRAFATIVLSLVIIGFGIFAISIFDEDKTLLSIAFECFSAYSTVGLSVGITTGLTTASKMILVLIMFIGRVSMLSILIAVMKKTKYKNYRYPTEEITIN